MKLAYLSQGKLYFKNGDLPPQQIDSPFAQDLVSRTLHRYEQNEWKAKAQQDSPFRMLWGTNEADGQKLNVNITSVTRGTQPGEMLYGLETDTIGGLFLYEWDNQTEKRLVHKKDFLLRDLNRHPETGEVVCSHYAVNGTANIGLVRGHNVTHLTEGDSVDETPRWVAGQGKRIVFQSAGVARGQQGIFIGVGPFAIQELNLDGGSMAILLEDPNHDLLLPYKTADGDLYFIRRPYERLGRRPVSFLGILSDIVLFPFRLGRAIFHYFNFMSLVYSRKPLTTSGGPKVEGDDPKLLVLRGRRIDAEKALREGGRNNDAPALVPSSWELVQQKSTGQQTVLARGVVAFDVDAAGNVVYTNGTAVYHLMPDQGSRLLFKGRLIENLYLLD